MQPFPQALYNAAQSRELDRRAMEEQGIPAAELMRRAGEAAWRVLRGRWPQVRHIAVVAGAGNNAGDGYVVAAGALRDRRQVTVVNVGDATRLSGAAADARKQYLEAGGREQVFSGASPAAEVLVDALLGTGLDRPLQGDWAEAVRVMNACGKPVLALDIPSGLNADTGAIMGVAVHAAATVTFIALKTGLFTAEGPACRGDLSFTNLDVPAAVHAGMEPAARRLGDADMPLPRRPRSAHKGDFGHVLVMGGNHGMGGAVRLTAEAALRSGAGLVTIATRAGHVSAMLAGLPEAMACAVDTAADVAPLMARATVVAIGPGLGQDAWSRELLRLALNSRLPLVVDADALNLLAAAPLARGNWVLTPHPGEAGRLLGLTTAAVQQDRYHAISQLTEKYQGVSVLKGAGTLVAAAGETIAVCGQGNPGMAAPGMGDLLTGIIAALIAQGLALPAAARAGVMVHALAGDHAARDGERGLTARDVIKALRRMVNP